MGSGLLNVSVSGLNVAQMGLLTTSHNIANASTPGYNRQSIVQTTNTPMFSGAGFVGQGANVQTVKRVYNDFLAGQVQTSSTAAASLETYSQQIAQIDNLLADPNAGLSPAMQEFFSAVGAAAANPSSLAGRQAMLSAAQVMSARFQSLDQQLTGIRDGTNEKIGGEVVSINSFVSQIAGINQQIVLAQAMGGGEQPANDLLDQRDQLLADLNKHIQVTSHLESDGSYSVFFGSGQPLVIGTQGYQLAALADREDLANLQVGLVLPGSPSIPIPESLIAGGTLGGLLNFRSVTLDSAQNSLGRIAVALTTDFNAQHALGQDLTGAIGGNFFRPITLSTLGAPANVGGATLSARVAVSDYKVSFGVTGYTITRLSDDSNLGTFGSLPQVVDGLRISLAAGSPGIGDTFLIHPDAPTGQRSTSFAANIGSAALESTGSNVQSLSTADYRLVMTGTNAFSLERLSDHQIWNGSGANQAAGLAELVSRASPLGFDLSLNGTMQIGDSFLIRPTRFGARDIALAVNDARDIALAAPIRTSTGLANAGTATISQGSVSDTTVALSAPFTITYEQSSNSFTGFPVGATVVASGQTYKIAGSTTRVPYTANGNISLNGVGVAITGVPVDGDSFTINPPPTPPSVANIGYATLFGAPTASTQGAAIGSAAPPLPWTPAAGTDDAFDITVDGVGPTTITLGGGPYATSAALATALQTAIGAGVTVSVDPPSGGIVVTSNTSGGASSISLAASGGNTGLASIFGVGGATSGIRGVATAGTALANPTTIVTGSNDRFRVAMDGGAAAVVTLPAGSYAPAALATALQGALDATLPAPGASVGLNGANQLVLTSNTVGGASNVALATANLGTGIILTSAVQSTSSLPVQNITLTFQKATAIPARPDRMSGFPVGSVVTVTPVGGRPVNYTISSTSDYIPYTSGATVAFNGLSIVISGAPVNGDTFTVGPNASGVADNRNAALLGALQSHNTMADATATYQTVYSQMVSEVGNKAREVEVKLTAQQNLVEQGATAIASLSGVNLDEEAANLLKYQQAYQASAKIIDISGKLFDQLLTLG